MIGFGNRLRALSQQLASVATDKGAQAGLVLLFFVMLGIVAWFNPAKLLSITWLVAKLIGGALVGAAIFHAWDKGKREGLEGIERAMADTRLTTMMAAGMFGAGLLA